MSWKLKGGTGLAARAVRATAQVGADAVRHSLGRALPLTPEALARPQVVSTLIGTPLRDVRLTGDRFDSSNCQNFLIDIEDAEGAGRRLYAKLPARELAPRVFANTLGYWHLECAFCARVADRVPVRVPRVEAVVEQGSRFVLLLEDLTAVPGTRLFVNADMAAGTTVDHALLCVTALARLHAGFQGTGSWERDRLLPPALHPYLSSASGPAMRTLNLAAVRQARRKAAEMVPVGVADTYERALERWPALVAHWYTGPLTLVHGDSHLANSFQYETDEGPAVGWLDFQGVHWSKGIRDVAYFLIHSLDADLLAAHEAELVDHYISEMGRLGVELDPERTRDDYRGFSFQALMVGIVAVGLGGFTERESTVACMLRREVAAVERLDFAGWLRRTTD
ncbi:MAG TPA: hypothetical protein VG435_14535 [Acidimicrobiales bacterium]|nr:hypothetical protein [Acidimicrobiales bacterium]